MKQENNKNSGRNTTKNNAQGNTKNCGGARNCGQGSRKNQEND